jgi:hypothetical protein
MLGAFVKAVMRVASYMDVVKEVLIGLNEYLVHNKLDNHMDLLLGGLVTNEVGWGGRCAVLCCAPPSPPTPHYPLLPPAASDCPAPRCCSHCTYDWLSDESLGRQLASCDIHTTIADK